MPLFENEAIFAAAPAPMLIVGVDRPSFTVIDVNDAYLAATNRPRAALVGLPLFHAMPDNPEDDQATGVSNLRSSIERAIATKRPDTMPVQKYDITHPDGGFEERWWDPVNSPMLGPDGKVIAVIHHVSDATERVRSDQALRRLNDTLEAQVAQRTAERDRIWKLSVNLLLVAKIDGTIVSASPAWESILGWPPEWLAGRNAAEIKHPDDSETTAAELARLRAGHPTLDFEDRYRHRDGSWRWISWMIQPEGELLYCSGRDVTAEKEQADVLRAAQEALRQSQKMEAVGQLTGGLAHDFNNLLGGISGSLELMQLRLQDGRFQGLERYVAAALGAARRAAALTHRLLAFSRRQTLAPKPTDVYRLAKDMQEFIQRTVGPSIAVDVVGGRADWPALVDPSQLENALLNLCINARDAMPQGGRICIETANQALAGPTTVQQELAEGEYLVLRVTDTGTGMSPEVLTHVFEPFFTTKPIGQGTGLGLSMIYGFAQQSGGQVFIDSQAGVGTTVSIYMPRYQGAMAEEEAITLAGQLPRSQLGGTVLVVDDEPTVRLLISDILEKLGYTTIEAGDSAAGLTILQSNVDIDLLITDIGLPGGMNGMELANAIRLSRPDLKVLFITGYAKEVVLGGEVFAPDAVVVTKPFSVVDMAAHIRALVNR